MLSVAVPHQHWIERITMPAFFTTVLTGVAAAVVEALLVRLAKAALARVSVHNLA